MKVGLILANQLSPDNPVLSANCDSFVMIEAQDVSRRYRYHQQKLAFLFSAMRHFAADQKEGGVAIDYHAVDQTPSFRKALAEYLTLQQATHLVVMQPADVSTTQRLQSLCDDLSITLELLPSVLFMTPPDVASGWFEGRKQPLMETFYRQQRKRTGYLMEGDQPLGGQWNYDADNRSALPKEGIEIPAVPSFSHDDMTQAVIASVRELFATHPGDASQLWLPVTQADANQWLDDFIAQRLPLFGKYEDAIKIGEPFLFHSALSALINVGLLSPTQVCAAVLQAYHSGAVPLSSAEGIIRQIIGWREYMYGLYLAHPEMKTANYFGFTKPLEEWWYNESATTREDVPLPVREALKTTQAYGYNHHIERLMVLGNWFLLNQYDPRSVYDWFMAMYVDAYEWVMVPNVMGMSQYADGGLTATKPYISGGNYLQKMGRYWPSTAAARDSEFTTKYWEFLTDNYDLLKGNHRMAMVLRQVKKD